MLSKHVSFTPENIHRREIKNAPYNPRQISKEARSRLKKNIATIGLVAPIVWNRTTGNIVGGHQRLSVLDDLERTDDYLVPVAAVEMDDTTEKVQNVFLNNTEAQGEWDLESLGLLLNGLPDLELTGFDLGDLHQIFGTNITGDSTKDAGIAASLAPPVPERIQAEIIEKKAKTDASAGTIDTGRAAKEPGDNYLVVLFPSDADRLAFTAKYTLPDNRYVDAAKLERLIRGEE